MNAPRPQIVTASESAGEVTLVADGVAVLVMDRKLALWLLSRLAETLARAS